MRSRRLGTTLRRYRLAADLDQEQAADALGCSTAKISRVESGINTAKVAEVRYLLELYGVSDPQELGRLEELARNANKRGWWMDYPLPPTSRLHDYIALETDATYIRTWQPVFVPGVLQTPDYTRALINASPEATSPQTTDLTLKIRQGRRRQFEESATRFAAIIGESALTAPMPSRQAHREQLAHIIRMADLSHVTVQVLPTTAWEAARSSPGFVALSFTPDTLPDAVVLDTLNSSIILEDPGDMPSYAHAFDGLRSSAWAPEQSVRFIKELLDSFGREETQ